PSMDPVYHAGMDIRGLDERRLIRKLDLSLISWLALLFLLSSLDRTSVGNGLNITDDRYLIYLTVIFFRYVVILPVPSKVVLQRLRPSVWLA
ncbi:hypothetical protein C8J57DRAFT_1009055, partial [Mycena rebaudengoi]